MNKKPLWLRIILKFLSLILSLALISGIALGIIQKVFNINLVKIISQLKTISKPINSEEIVKNPYSEEDKENIKKFIIINEEGILETTDEFTNTLEENSQIYFSDRELGALLDYLLSSNRNNELNNNFKDFKFNILQVDLFDINEETCDFNIILNLSLEHFKNNMKDFPLNILTNFIPDNFIVSSTVTIKKSITEDPFKWEIESKDLFINNLNSAQTKEIFDIFNKVLKIGDINKFNEIIGKTFVGLLLGNEENQSGICYKLYSNEPQVIKSFWFETIIKDKNPLDCLVLKK